MKKDSIRLASLCCFCFSILIGIIVLAGWILRLPHLAALFIPLPPMHYLTTLSFVIYGSSLLLMFFNKKIISSVLTGCVSLLYLGLFVHKLPQSFLGMLYPISQGENVVSFEFARFSIDTFFPFFLIGTAIFLISFPKKVNTVALITSQLLSLLVIVIFLNDLLAYSSTLGGILYPTKTFTVTPAIPITFIVLGASIFLFSISIQKNRLPIQKPFIIIGELILALLILQFYQLLEHKESPDFHTPITEQFTPYISETFIGIIAAAGAFHFFVFFYLNQEVSKKMQFIQISEQKLTSVIDTCADAIITIDAHGTVTSWNQGAEKIFGYTKNELEGQSLNVIIPQKYRKAHHQAIERVAVTKKSAFVGTTRELEGLRKDQTEFPIELSLGMWEAFDQTFFTGVIRDITQRKDAELTLIEGKKLAENANKMKTDFLSMMTHELRTPLTSIIGYTDFLLSRTLSQSDRYEYTRIIKRSSEFLLSIIKDILDIAKIEAGKLTIEKRFFSPQELFSDILSIMKERILNKGLSLNIEFATPIPEMMFSDPTLIRQIVLNLISNAVKFTSEGEIRIRLSMASQPDAPRQLFQVDVIDSGIGMSQEQIDKLFQPFTQADSSTTRKFGGTGLGLAISKYLVTALDGEIGCKSEVNSGSTFSFTVETGSSAGIQKIDKLEEEVKQTPQPKEIHLEARILLAEDSPDSQRLISTLLTYAGATVETADNGKIASEKALEAMAHEEPYDIILMDLMMPIMDGYEATSQLRSKGYKGIIIALTASSVGELLEKCRKLGFNDAITKPIEQDSFFATMHDHLNKR